jgi:hypothetical protein
MASIDPPTVLAAMWPATAPSMIQAMTPMMVSSFS